MAKKRVTARKFEGDDAASWAVFIDGRPFVTGLAKSEVPYYRRQAEKSLAERSKNHGNGSRQ
jgi:hypothetical protein